MNIQSIRNKIDLVQCFVYKENCDILVVSETWLEKNETYSFELENYSSVHSCRVGRGGGVAIYVRKTIKFREVDQSNDNDIVNWICIALGEQNAKLSVVYKPPSHNNKDFFPYLESILLKHPKSHLIIGDMNINLLDDSQMISDYKNLLRINNFKIVNTICEKHATRTTESSKSLIDHVLSDSCSKIDCNVSVKDNALSDHKLLLIDIKDSTKMYKPKVNYEITTVDYKRFQYLVQQKVQTVNITTFQHLINIIQECKVKSERKKILRIRENNYWLNEEILELMVKRDTIYKQKLKQPQNLNLVTEFKKIKNQINNKIKALKNRYFQSKFNLAGNNIKKQWTFINSFFKRKTEGSTIDALKIGNILVHNKVDIANNLNRYFSDVGSSISKELENEIRSSGAIFEKNEIYIHNTVSVDLTDEQEVNETILELKINSAPGHDGITVRDVLNLRPYIVKILIKLINNVIITGTFPDELKISKITPLYKLGDKDSMNNYRPISVISVLSKIVEKIIKKRMMIFLNENTLTDSYQYGFIKNSSTLSAAVDFVNYISRALDEKHVVIAVFIDLRKAFDVVDINILLHKLQYMGFRGTIYKLIKTYLLNRKQYVKIGETNSEWLSSNCGVPQGSVLGPLLYSLYVLSLKGANLNARYFTFADDTVLLYKGTSEQALQDEVNSDLTLYCKWLYSNKLKINIDKTKYQIFKQKNKIVENLRIRINKVDIEKVSCIKYLGLTIDENMNWSSHIKKFWIKLHQ